MNTLFGFEVSTLTLKETTDYIISMVASGERAIREDLNAAKVVWCQKKGPIRDAVESATIINPDGQSVVWAARILDIPIKERVTGIDLMQELIKRAPAQRLQIYLLGAHASTVSALANHISMQHGEGIIAGFSDGYFSEQDEMDIVKTINDTNPDMLFIGISSPKKEEFVLRNAEKLNARLIMGVGGSFDVLAGKTPRAPQWMQDNGLEWFYRFIQEPGRMWKRYLVTNSHFIAIVAREWWLKNKVNK